MHCHSAPFFFGPLNHFYDSTIIWTRTCKWRFSSTTMQSYATSIRVSLTRGFTVQKVYYTKAVRCENTSLHHPLHPPARSFPLIPASLWHSASPAATRWTEATDLNIFYIDHKIDPSKENHKPCWTMHLPNETTVFCRLEFPWLGPHVKAAGLLECCDPCFNEENDARRKKIE